MAGSKEIKTKIKKVQNTRKITKAMDKGLCGGLNTNVLRMALAKMREWESQGESFEVCCIGNKGLGFMQRLGANVASHVGAPGATPHMDKLIGAVKVMLGGSP